nr:heavy metal-associated isoprenylated plant protein 47-like [Ipomoea batatas]
MLNPGKKLQVPPQKLENNEEYEAKVFTLQQKITISLPVNTERCLAKAMKIAAGIRGVKSVGIEEEKNQLVVKGEGIDSIKLMKGIKKKFKCANIHTIEKEEKK